MNDRDSGDFWHYVNKSFNDKVFLYMTTNLSNDEEMMKTLKPLFNWTPSTSNNDKRFKKSSVKSIKYAEEAIKAANAGQQEKSLKLANMITAFAKDAGDLALGHLIRAQLLDFYEIDLDWKIDEVDFCIKSPEPAKQINANIKLKQSHGNVRKLSKKDVLLYLLNPSLLLKDLRAERESPLFKKYYEDLEKQQEMKRKYTRDIFTLKSPNPKAPALEDFVEIKYDSIKGRHLVVTKDVPAGTTLLVEKPFVCGLARIFDLEICRCHHCFNENFRPTPCPNCVFVLYCSEKCLEELKEYHKKYECSIYPDLHSILSPMEDYSLFLCAFAAICTFGPHEIFRVFKNEQESSMKKSVDSAISGFDPDTGIYDSSSFYTLIHMQKIKIPCLPQDTLIALALTKILEARTDFFQQLELQLKLKSPQVKTQFQDFITLSIINIRKSFGNNQCVGGQSADHPFPWVYSTLSTLKLTNHSCDGNLEEIQTLNLKGLGFAQVARRDLKKGEELCRNYLGSFLDGSKSVRQINIWQKYSFKCECVACLNDWPLMRTLEAEKDRPKFCCPLCSYKIPPVPKMMTKDNYGKIALNSGNNFICSQCKSKYKEKELLSQFKKNSMALNIAEKLIKTGSGQETLKSLKEASSFFQNYLIPPSFYREKCLVVSAMVNSMTAVYD